MREGGRERKGKRERERDGGREGEGEREEREKCTYVHVANVSIYTSVNRGEECFANCLRPYVATIQGTNID